MIWRHSFHSDSFSSLYTGPGAMQEATAPPTGAPRPECFVCIPHVFHSSTGQQRMTPFDRAIYQGSVSRSRQGCKIPSRGLTWGVVMRRVDRSMIGYAPCDGASNGKLFGQLFRRRFYTEEENVIRQKTSGTNCKHVHHRAVA